MNLQPANAYPDAHIDQVLEALRTTEPPTGLEQRIAARLAQAAEARTLTTSARTLNASTFTVTDGRATTSLFAVILNVVKDPRIRFAEAPLYIVAGTALALLLTLTTLTLLHHRTPPAAAQSKPIPNRPYAPAQPAALAQASGPANTQVPQGFSLGSSSSLPNTQVPQGFRPANTQVPQGFSPANTQVPQGFSPGTRQVPQGFSLGPHTASQRAGVLTPAPSQQSTDPDAIALAETLAPSRPAPPMPLTPQELIMLAATRPGQPIQVAELDIARAPFLRAAAEARENASIDRYVKSFLGAFALADALSPTTDSQPQQTSTPAPAPPPSNSSSN